MVIIVSKLKRVREIRVGKTQQERVMFSIRVKTTPKLYNLPLKVPGHAIGLLRHNTLPNALVRGVRDQKRMLWLGSRASDWVLRCWMQNEVE